MVREPDEPAAHPIPRESTLRCGASVHALIVVFFLFFFFGLPPIAALGSCAALFGMQLFVGHAPSSTQAGKERVAHDTLPYRHTAIRGGERAYGGIFIEKPNVSSLVYSRTNEGWGRPTSSDATQHRRQKHALPLTL